MVYFLSKKHKLCNIVFLDSMSHHKHGANNVALMEWKRKFRGNTSYYFLLDTLDN